MSTDTPVQYFFICSKATSNKGERLAITANPNGEVHVNNLNYQDENQMWSKTKVTTRTDAQHPIFGLISKGQNKCIVRDTNHQGANLLLKTTDVIQFNELSMWRDEPAFGGINSYADWEQKINIPGNGPYVDGQRLVTWGYSGGAPNESWFYVDDQTKTELIKFAFHMTTTDTFTKLQPDTKIDDSGRNELDDPVPLKVDFTYEVEDTVTFKDESGFKFGVDTEVTVGIPDIGEGSLKFGTESSTKEAKENGGKIKKSVTLKTKVTVPPKSKAVCSIMFLRGQLDVPYTATMRYTYGNGKTVDRDFAGVFTRVSAYSSVVQVDVDKI